MTRIWLASYPKSGNTWLRLLLNHLLLGRLERLAELNAVIPDVHQVDVPPLKDGEIGFAKSHFVYSRSHPFVRAGDKVVYIVRHPRDVLVSSISYVRKWQHKGWRASLVRAVRSESARRRRLATEFIDRGGLPVFVQAGYGTWTEHVLTWNGQRSHELLCLRYEDLKRDTAGELGRVARFAGLDRHSDELEAAVQACKLERLQAKEKKETTEGSAKASMPRGYQFFRAGAVGSSLASLGMSDLDEAFDRRFAPFLEMAGFDS